MFNQYKKDLEKQVQMIQSLKTLDTMRLILIDAGQTFSEQPEKQRLDKAIMLFDSESFKHSYDTMVSEFKLFQELPLQFEGDREPEFLKNLDFLTVV